MIHAFLGYNCWSSKIVEIEGLEFNPLEDGFFSARYRTLIRLTFKVLTYFPTFLIDILLVEVIIFFPFRIEPHII